MPIDDSNDGSLEELGRLAKKVVGGSLLMTNEQIGLGYRRRYKGSVSSARGDYLWIAEADD